MPQATRPPESSSVQILTASSHVTDHPGNGHRRIARTQWSVPYAVYRFCTCVLMPGASAVPTNSTSGGSGTRQPVMASKIHVPLAPLLIPPERQPGQAEGPSAGPCGRARRVGNDLVARAVRSGGRDAGRVVPGRGVGATCLGVPGPCWFGHCRGAGRPCRRPQRRRRRAGDRGLPGRPAAAAHRRPPRAGGQ